jgi:anti-sigma factor RsiW
MTCEMWRNKLDAYVDSELPDNELADIEVHLRACPSCAADSLGRLQMKRMTQAAGARYAPSPEFRQRIEQSISKKRRPIWRFDWMPKLVAAAALMLLVVGSASIWMQHAQREQALTELADLHVATLASANPIDVVSTDRHTVKPWFAGKLPFTFNLPELQGSPFKLIGGRLTYLEHNPGAQLLFDVGKHQLSVFIFQDRPGTMPFGPGEKTARKLAFNMETWAEGGLRYVVISDSDWTAVHGLSELLRGAARS